MNTNYDYLRPKKAEALQKRKNSGFCRKDELSCHHFNNATILPLKRIPGDTLLFGRGGVLDSNQLYVESSGIFGRVGGTYPHTSPIEEDKCVVYCGYLIKHWGHFLVEAVARLWYFLENDPAVDKYVFITDENASLEIGGNYAAFLHLLGLDGKVEIINRPIKYRKVLVPELAYSRNHYYSDRFRDIFETIAQNAIAQQNEVHEPYPKRIYFSRSQFNKAQQLEAGLDLLDNYFEKNSYTILFPEKLTLSEMIAYIRNAEVCAGESGTIPHNMLFASDKQTLIVVERQTVINEIQAQIDIIRNLDVTYIDAHYTIYPVSAGYGPYFLAYTKSLQNFTKDHGYLPPDERYFSRKNMRKNLNHYMKAYKMAYGYAWGLEDWQLQYADAIYEAYADSMGDLRPYLMRSKPFALRHLFELHYFRQALKQLLHVLRLR